MKNKCLLIVSLSSMVVAGISLYITLQCKLTLPVNMSVNKCAPEQKIDIIDKEEVCNQLYMKAWRSIKEKGFNGNKEGYLYLMMIKDINPDWRKDLVDTRIRQFEL